MLDTTKIYNDLYDELSALDLERKRYRNRVRPFEYLLQFIFVIAGSFMLLRWNLQALENFLFPDDQKQTILIWWSVGFVVSLLVFAIVHSINLGKFKKLFANQIGPKIIKGLGPDFTYDYQGKIDETGLEDSLLFGKYNTFSCQDLVTGTLQDTPIKFAELKMELNTGSGDKRRTKKIFEGIFFRADLKFSFPTGIWLIPDLRSSTILKSEKSTLEIDHPALNKFKVYTDDEEMARQVLQPFILDRIDQLNEKLKKEKITFGRTRYHFEGQQIELAIPTLGKFLEPKLSRSMLDVKFIEEQVVLLNALSTLLQDLTLK